jgi:predicted nicotinamide N-methyase
LYAIETHNNDIDLRPRKTYTPRGSLELFSTNSRPERGSLTLTYKTSTVSIHGHDLIIRHFIDKNQFPTAAEQDDIGAKVWGIEVPESLWPLVGTIWPSGLVLAEAVAGMDLQNKRILEIGCGLGLASLVAHHGGHDVTASDYNAFAGALLKENATLNGLSPLKFLTLSFQDHFKGEPYDLIVASDVLYEPGCGSSLIQFLKTALKNDGEAVFVDPGRAHVGKFESELIRNGFTCKSDRPVKGDKIRLITIRHAG